MSVAEGRRLSAEAPSATLPVNLDGETDDDDWTRSGDEGTATVFLVARQQRTWDCVTA